MGEDFQIRPIWFEQVAWDSRRTKSPQDLNDAEVNALFAAVDHDGNDAISFEEFCVLARILSWRLKMAFDSSNLQVLLRLQVSEIDYLRIA